jgi:cold shock protein
MARTDQCKVRQSIVSITVAMTVGMLAVPSGAAALEGTVKWFNNSKGYGFITPNGGGKDVFIDFSDIQGPNKTLQEGQAVTFDVLFKDRRGKSAVNLTLVDFGSSSTTTSSSKASSAPTSSPVKTGAAAGTTAPISTPLTTSDAKVVAAPPTPTPAAPTVGPVGTAPPALSGTGNPNPATAPAVVAATPTAKASTPKSTTGSSIASQPKQSTQTNPKPIVVASKSSDLSHPKASVTGAKAKAVVVAATPAKPKTLPRPETKQAVPASHR